MAHTEKLYDIEKNDHPNKRGDEFRSIQIWKCSVCHALTNRVMMGGSPGLGTRIGCPNDAECWHHELRRKALWLEKPHPKAYREALALEVEELRLRHTHEAKNDLVGSPDHAQMRTVLNPFSRRVNDRHCPHDGHSFD